MFKSCSKYRTFFKYYKDFISETMFIRLFFILKAIKLMFQLFKIVFRVETSINPYKVGL